MWETARIGKSDFTFTNCLKLNIYQFVENILNYSWPYFHKFKGTKIHHSKFYKCVFLFRIIFKALHNLVKGLFWAIIEYYEIIQEDIFTAIFY
jgi:hypothetical protein